MSLPNQAKTSACINVRLAKSSINFCWISCRAKAAERVGAHQFRTWTLVVFFGVHAEGVAILVGHGELLEWVKTKEFMLDMRSGQVAYAVMSSGGVFTIGQKLFAVPFKALKLDTANHRFTLDMPENRIEFQRQDLTAP